MKKIIHSLLLGATLSFLAPTPKLPNIAHAKSQFIEQQDIELPGLEGITAQEVKNHIYHLASEELEGRQSGKRGEQLAADYIRNEFQRLGLIPVGDNGTYLQEFQYSAWRRSKVKAHNVLGLLEGRDSTRQDELIIIGAHYDHLGIHNGVVYNGADDNASGTAAVLEIAEAFALLPENERPRRSILFIAFSGEEDGLFGSAHYVHHPARPLKSTVAMINLDMIGRNNPNKAYLIGGSVSPDLEVIARQQNKREGLQFNLEGGYENILYRSDHYWFWKKQVPVLAFFTGEHKDYHLPSDDAEKIDNEKVQRIAQLTYLILEELSYANLIDLPKRPR